MQKPYVPLGNHTNRVCQKKRPLILWAQGTLLGISSQWLQQLIRRGRLRTSAKAGEIWRNRDRVPAPGRNQFRAALRMGSSQQSTIMRFRMYKESNRPFRHAHFINTVKLSTTFPSRSLGREHLPETAASETLQHSFEY